METTSSAQAEPDGWERLAATMQSMANSIESIVGTFTRALERIDAEMAEIRDGLVEIDHAKAPHEQVNELRVEVAALRDDLSVLRNDYRGEPA